MSQEHEFASLLKKRRTSLGWTQAELARRTGYSLAAIKKFEQGARRPPREEARRIAEVLDLSNDSAEYEALVGAARGRASPRRSTRAAPAAEAPSVTETPAPFPSAGTQTTAAPAAAADVPPGVLNDGQAAPAPPTTIRSLSHEPQAPVRSLATPATQAPADAGPVLTPRQRKRDPRYALIDKVRWQWIAGVLTPSFTALAPIRPQLNERPALVATGAGATLAARAHAGRATLPLPLAHGRSIGAVQPIAAIFEAARGELLIVGAPGAGKTTALLMLADWLLDLAEHNSDQPVPVVFNLASWGEQRRPLAEWLVTELNEHYKLARKTAQHLLDSDQLILLLDGLDEIHPTARADCVRAINAFHAGRIVDLVVCCRTADYEDLDERLALQAAIALDPLSSQQIDQALAEQGAALAALRYHLAHDATLRVMAAAPLMLSIMATVYQETVPPQAAPDQVPATRRRLFENYVCHVLNRHQRSASSYDSAQTRRALAWLAGRMQADSQTVFYPDQLQADWLTPSLRWRYVLLDRCATAALAGLVLSGAFLAILVLYALVARPHPVYVEGLLVDTLAVFLLGSLVGGLFGTVSVHPSYDGDAIWPQARKRVVGCLTGGLLFGIIAAAMTGSLAGAIMASILGATAGTVAPLPSLRPRRVVVVEPRRWSWRRTLCLLPACVSGGATLGLLIGVLIGEIDGLLGPLLGPLGGSVAAGLLTGLGVSVAFGLSHSEALHEPDRPNQGIIRSLHNALLAGLLGFLLGGLLGLYVAVGPVTWLIMGAQGALVSALAFGLFSVFAHCSLRVILWRSGVAPLRYLRFLDSCVDRVLLRRIGGGYSFVHQELLNYFAEQATPIDAIALSSAYPGEQQRRWWHVRPILLDIAGLMILIALLYGTITVVRQSEAADLPPQTTWRIEPGPGYTGRVVSDYPVQAGDRLDVTAYGRIDIGTFERDVPPQGRERGFMGSPLGDSFKLVPDYPTGALLCKVTGEDEVLWRLCGPEATFETQAGGQLEFLINDNAITKHAGAFGVVVDIVSMPE